MREAEFKAYTRSAPSKPLVGMFREASGANSLTGMRSLSLRHIFRRVADSFSSGRRLLSGSADIVGLTQKIRWRPAPTCRSAAVLSRLARRTEHKGLGPTQRRRYSPACRLFVGFDAFPQVPQNVVSPAVWNGKQLHGSIHIQALAQTLGEALDRIECDIIETMQLVDDDRLDQLVETEGTARRLIIVRLVDLVDQVAAE